MKRILIIITILFLQQIVVAQKEKYIIRMVACKRDYLDPIKDSLKKVMATKGFISVVDTSFFMESSYEMSLPVPLRAGTNYFFYFISEPFTRYSEIRMYDYEERQIASIKNGWAEKEGNIIGWGHISPFDQWHMIKPVQGFKKKKDMCGYFLIFKKVK